MRSINFKVCWMVVNVNMFVLISAIAEFFNNLEGAFDHDDGKMLSFG